MRRLTVRCSIGTLFLVACATGWSQAWRLKTWSGFAGDPQHTAMSRQMSAGPLKRILWSTSVDLHPQYAGYSLLAHYSPPLITPAGLVLVTVKTGDVDGFEVQARNEETGVQFWTETTDYLLPPHSWIPACGTATIGFTGMAVPGIGGTILVRTRTDKVTSSTKRFAFFGTAEYTAHQAAYNAGVYICTPLTVDAAGNTYFGYRVLNSTPKPLQSGLAKVSVDGQGTWISAIAATKDSTILEPEMNCAPAVSNDGKTVYIGMSRGDGTGGYLVGVDTATFKAKYSIRLTDPRTQQDAILLDESSSSPMVGPDGDVYFGVYESQFYNSRGWMLHFDEKLSQVKTPGSFGWDSTASVVPAGCVPSYQGKSSYLILTKYNDYVGVGPLGTGENRLAILDPNSGSPEALNGPTASGSYVNSMTIVLAVAGVTRDTGANLQVYPNAVREWCVNTTVVDVEGRCAIVNSEDGKLYRWDFVSNSLTQAIVLNGGIGEAYTPTVIGSHGISYAINQGVLSAIGY